MTIADNASSEMIANTDVGAGPQLLNLRRMMTRTSDSAAQTHAHKVTSSASTFARVASHARVRSALGPMRLVTWSRAW